MVKKPICEPNAFNPNINTALFGPGGGEFGGDQGARDQKEERGK